MAKTGITGVRDDSDTVSTGNVQTVLDLGELGARASGLYSVSRSGNLIDVVEFSKGLGQVKTGTAGVGSYVRVSNYPVSDSGASCMLGVFGGASNACYIQRDIIIPADSAIGFEVWFAAVSNAGIIQGYFEHFDGAKCYIYKWAFNYATGKLTIATLTEPLGHDVATIDLYSATYAFNKVKMIIDLAGHEYNRIQFNNVVYQLNGHVPNDNNDTRGPYAEQYVFGYGSAAGAAAWAIGKMITTQAEPLTVC
jgi:hypothetical protein